MGNGLSPCLSMSAAAESRNGQAGVMEQADRFATGGRKTGAACRPRQCPFEYVKNGPLLRQPPGPQLPIAWPGERLLPGQSYLVVCPAQSFVGLLVPIAWPRERLLLGQTCFVVPRRHLSNPPGGNSSGKAATLGSLLAAPGAGRRGQLACHGQCPFEYVKGGDDGSAVLIQVLLQFIEKRQRLPASARREG
ncbi:hypothetical protein VPH35_134204 [Triticum aestivum]